MPIEIPHRLSYSSLSSYAECGERWKLERGYGLGNSTWYATVAGSAIHEITEKIDFNEWRAVYEPDAEPEEVPTFQEEFDRRLAEEEKNNVTVKPSGKKLKNMSISGGPNKKDYEWWLVYGPLAVEKWMAWKAESDWMLATMPDGKPGIEVVLRAQMAGDDHLGFIDRVYITPDGELVIVDLKTGEVPKSNLQLGSYRVALMREHGLIADWGTYWMAKDGELTPLKDLTGYDEEYIDAQYDMAWRGIRDGIFLPNVTSMCNGCGVRDWCRAVGGVKSRDLPATDELVVKPRKPDVSEATQPQVDTPV